MEMEVTIPAHLSYTGQARRKVVGIDSCIAPIVAALNAGGLPTVASCCGHGKRPGNVALTDGRELVIAPDFDTARKVDRAFPAIFPKSDGAQLLKDSAPEGPGGMTKKDAIAVPTRLLERLGQALTNANDDGADIPPDLYTAASKLASWWELPTPVPVSEIENVE
jgi:hypothetical protein